MAVTVQAIIRLSTLAETGGIDLLNSKLQGLVGTLNGVNMAGGKAGGGFNSLSSIARNLGTPIRQIGQAMMSFGQTMIIATAPIALFGKNAIEVTSTWQQSMAAVKASSTPLEFANGQVNALGKGMLDASKKFTFSANDMLFSALALKQAGFDLGAAQAATVAGATLTTAAFDVQERTSAAMKTTTMDLAQATRMFNGELITNAQQTGDYTKLQGKLNENADIFAKILNTSSARMGDFIQGFNYLAPVTSNMNMSLQDTGIAIGLVSDKGIEGSRAGRELASALLQMSNASPKVKDMMDNLGISLFDSKGKAKGLRDIVGQLNTALYGTGMPARAATVELKTLGSKAVDASEKVTIATAKFASNQKSAGEAIAKSAQKASAAQKEALKVADAAIDGSSATVQQQTLALMKNSAAWNKLPKSVQSQIIALTKSTEAVEKDQEAYNKATAGTNKMVVSAGKLTDAERAKAAAVLFGNAGVRAMIPLVKGGTVEWDKYTKAIKNGKNAAQLAKEKMDNFKDSVALLKNNVEAAMIKAFLPIMEKFLTPLVQWLTKVVDWFDKLDQSTKEWTIGIAALLVVLGPVLFFLGSMLFTFGMLSSGFAGLSVLMAATTGPVTLLGTIFGALGSILRFSVIGAIIGMAVALINNTNGIRDKMMPVLGGVIDRLKDLWKWLQIEIPRAISTAKAFFESFGETILTKVDFKKIFESVDRLAASLKRLWEVFFPPDSQKNASQLGKELGTVIANVINELPKVIDAITRITDFLVVELPKWKAEFDKTLPGVIDSINNLINALIGPDGLIVAITKTGTSIDPGAITFFQILGAAMDTVKFFADLLTGALKLLTGAIDAYNKQAAEISPFNQKIYMFNNPQKKQQGPQDTRGAFELGGPDDPTSPSNWIKGIEKFFKDMGDAWKGASEDFDTSLENINASTEQRTKSGIEKFIDAMKVILFFPMGNSGIPNFNPDMSGIDTVTKKLDGAASAASAAAGSMASSGASMKTTLEKIAKISQSTLDSVSDNIKNLQAKWGLSWEDIRNTVVTQSNNITATINTWKSTVENTWNSFMSNLRSIWQGLWNFLSVYVWAGMMSVWNTLNSWGNTLRATWSGLVSGLQTAWNNFCSGLPSAVLTGINAAIAIARQKLAELKNLITGATTPPPTPPPTGGGGGSGNDRAFGGSVLAGTAHLVGERGPEMFVPGWSGTIMPNNMLPAMAGGNNQTINVNIGSVKDSNDAYLLAREVARIIRENS